jgi:hypothetical protein
MELSDLMWDYSDFRKKYEPVVHTVERSQKSSDRMLAAEGLSQIADLWWIMGAPLRAITYYRRALKKHCNCYDLVELARRYGEVGRKPSLNKILKELESDFSGHPDFINLQTDIVEELVEMDDDYDSPIHLARESLARHKPKKALSELGRMRKLSARLWRAAAYSVSEDVDAALNEWKHLQNLDERIYLGFSDWFYLSEEMYDSSQFWQCLKALLPCLDHSVFPYHDSLSDRFPGARGALRRRKLYVEYHVVRTTQDLMKGRRLLKQYPYWIELKDLVADLSKGNAI